MDQDYSNVKNGENIVILFNGNFKFMKDITTDDLLMGDDSTPRRIIKKVIKTDKIYKVVPIKGNEFIIGETQLLSLKNNSKVSISDGEKEVRVSYKFNGKRKTKSFTVAKYGKEFALGLAEEFKEALVENVDYHLSYIESKAIEKYNTAGATYKNEYRLHRIGITFPTRDVPFDPWLLGYWLGDGTSCRSEISTADPEVLLKYREKLEPMGLVLVQRANQYVYCISGYKFDDAKRNDNVMLHFLQAYSLINNKHIPDIYKYNSREVRLGVLAGLIDSDGYFGETYFEIIQKNVRLSADIIFLARSLGYSCYDNVCEKTCTNSKNGPVTGEYIRMNICSDNLHEVPTILPRKQVAVKEKKRREANDVTGFKVQELGVGEYFDIEVDGNKKYLHYDFIVANGS